MQSAPRATPPPVVVGGGPAAATAVRTLADASGVGVVVITAEPLAPYDRTTLSKRLLLDPDGEAPALWEPGGDWLERVDLRTGRHVVSIDPDGHQVVTDRGEAITFSRLLLATGAQPRRLTVPGADGPGVHHLRDLADARALRADLHRAGRVAIVGGGVIGLEVAATARALGKEVHVIEAGPRVLGRAFPEAVAGWLADLHVRHGVRISVDQLVEQVERDPGGAVTGVRLGDGTRSPAEVVVVGIGVVPRDDLARAAGLSVDDGIVVDRSGRTSHPDVYAAGDVARMRDGDGGRGTRTEAYQAAGRQGEVAARALLGGDDTYDDVLWTWSDQYDATVQSAGLAPDAARTLVCGGADAVLVLSLVGDRVVAVSGAGSARTVARAVRAAQRGIGAEAAVDPAALERDRADLSAVTKLLTAATRGEQTARPGPA